MTNVINRPANRSESALRRLLAYFARASSLGSSVEAGLRYLGQLATLKKALFGGTFARLILLGAVDEHAMLQKMAKQFETEGDWAWGVAKSHQELDEADWEFWRSRSPDERLAATFQASFDAWMLHDGNRLDGIDLTAFGVRKLGTDVEERP